MVEQLRSPKVQVAQPGIMDSRKALKEIREMSEQMESADPDFDLDDILFELEDALRTMIVRWDTCLKICKEQRLHCKQEIESIANIGMEYLKNLKEATSI